MQQVAIILVIIMNVFISTFVYSQPFDPIIETPGNKVEFCLNHPITLVFKHGLNNEDIQKFNWEGDVEVVNKNLGDILIVSPTKAGSYSFRCTATDKNGCEFSASITFRILDVVKPILKLENGKPTLVITQPFKSIKYMIDNKVTEKEAFQEAKMQGNYWVSVTFENGCSASSNFLTMN